MNLLKLNLIALAIILTAGLTNAKTGNEHAIIRQNDEHKITLTAKAETDHPMTIEIRNNKGEVVFTDELKGNGIVRKTYDLSETKVGEYNISVLCKDKNFPSTFISDENVEVSEKHRFVLN